MNPFIQGETSSGPSVHSEKRKRGRPRKDRSIMNIEGIRVTSGSRDVNKTNGAQPQSMVGQPVAGFIEASFDAGFLLSVRIGNSNTTLRGVVFKPGHFTPIKPENDVAPHLQMITRDDINFPSENRSWSRRPKLAIVKASGKRGSATPQPAASVASLGSRGNVVPVILQHVDSSSFASQLPPDGSLLSFGDNDVHMVEPLSIIPPDRATPINTSFICSPLPSSLQVSNATTSIFGLAEKSAPTESTDTDDMTSLESSDSQTENGIEEELNVSVEQDSGTNAKEEETEEVFSATTNFSISPHIVPVANPLFSYGAGRMTELLQAVQENIKEKQVHNAEQKMASNTKVESSELGTSQTYPNS